MPIDYKRVALDDLRAYPLRREALENIKRKIAVLAQQYQSFGQRCADSVPVQGGESRTEDRMLSNIVERERLKLNYRVTKQCLSVTERGLAALSGEERRILTAFAEAGRADTRTADVLAGELGMDRSTVYRIRADALYRFTLSCYGIADL